MEDSRTGVILYAEGPISSSVCAPKEMPEHEVCEAASRISPDPNFPFVVSDESFRTGEPNPCPCNDDEGKLHWLLVR